MATSRRGLSAGSTGRICTFVPSDSSRSIGFNLQPTAAAFCELAPAVERYVVARALARVDLARPRDLLLRVVDHLQPLGDPAARARDREHDREHLHRQAERLVDQARVEV